MDYWIDAAHPHAKDDNPGSRERPFRTINAGLKLAHPGDAVIVRPGIYRETVTLVRSGEPGKPITIRSEVVGGAIIRGSEVVIATPLAPGYHEVTIPVAVIAHRNPFALPLNGSQIGGTCGQVFVGGEMLREVGNPKSVADLPGTWSVLDGGKRLALNIASNRAPGPVELSIRDRLFVPERRGMGHLVVENFVFEHCANQSAAAFWEKANGQTGAIGLRAGHHILFRRNVVRFAKTIGMDIGIEGGKDRNDEIEPHDNALIDNVISDNGEVGACGQTSHRTIIRGNRVERNGCLSLTTVEEAGLKFHSFYDGLIEGNIIRDNDAAGIWLDAVWTGARISRNFVVNNLGSGIFVELGADGATVDNNIVAYTRLGDGIYTHDASDVLVAHNLVFGNAHFGIYMRYVTDRPFPHKDGKTRPAECSRQRILNNLFIDNYRGPLCLPAVGPRSKANISEHNYYINGTQWQWEGLGFHQFCLGDNDGDLPRSVLDAQLKAADVTPEVLSGNSYLTLAQWQALGFDLHSVAPGAFRITSQNGAVVKGTAMLGRDTYLRLRIKPDAACPPVPKLAEIDLDFHGRPRSHQTAPGPFAELGAGDHVFDTDPRTHLPSVP